MRKTLILVVIAFLLTGASLAYFVRFQPERIERKISAEEKQAETFGDSVVAPGVVEPVSEEIEVGTEIPGKIKEVFVEEGADVASGQTIAVLENLDFKTQVSEARAKIAVLERQKETAVARLGQAKADRRRINNGSRTEERRAARSGFEETLPEVARAKSEFERRQKLFASGDISREDLERARRNYETAERQSRTMRETFNVVDAPARTDDLERADAAILLAEAEIGEFDALIREAETRVRTAQANLDKTFIKSPVTGVVLRKRLKPGETVSPESEFGIVTVADVSALRVRVDLDETDVAKIRTGQKAFVKADAYGEKKFTGKVFRIGEILGRKNFRSERPTEKVDTKILEVLIELDAGQDLPLGLRVDAFIGSW